MRSLEELVAEILQKKTMVTWDVVRHACRLVLADADYNCAAANAKQHSNETPLRKHPSADEWLDRLGEIEKVHEDCERAWAEFQAADWSRGRFDVWATNAEAFCAALESNTSALVALKAKHFGPG